MADRLTAPDQLDESIQIVGPSDWLPLVVVTVLVAIALAWSILGRVSTEVSGRGVLIHPRGVVDLQTLGAGRIEGLRVRTGDRVQHGDVIGSVDQFELRRRLDEDRALLAELESQDKVKGRAQTEESARQRDQTAATRTYARSQGDNLRRSLADAEALRPLIEQRLTSVHALRDRGLLAASAPELLTAEQASLDNARKIAEVTAQLKQLDLQVAQSVGAETTLSRSHLDAESARRSEMQRLRAAIAVNDVQIEQNSRIVAPYDGRILEVLASNGRVVASGERIATIQVESKDSALIDVAYLAVGAGKKVREGMPVMVTPDGVERQRYGGITGKVLGVSDLAVTADGVRAVVGNAELAQGLLAGSPRIEVTVALDPDKTTPTGYHWSSSTGPASGLTVGLTGDVRVIVEERAPITYVLPFLRELTGTE